MTKYFSWSPGVFTVLLSYPTYSQEIFAYGIRNLRNFSLWNGESCSLESGIQLKESGIPLTIGIQNPSSTDKDWNSVPRIRNP